MIICQVARKNVGEVFNFLVFLLASWPLPFFAQETTVDITQGEVGFKKNSSNSYQRNYDSGSLEALTIASQNKSLPKIGEKILYCWGPWGWK